jgi:anti-anti-sigma factor
MDMQFTLSQDQGRVLVTILRLEGDLDAGSYQSLIGKAQELYRAGTRNLLLDLSDVPYVSSAGIVALHSVALLMRGAELPNEEDGWDSMRTVGREESAVQKHLKLLNPQPRVDRTLDMVGFKEFFEIYPDRAAAVASFRD